MDDRNAGDLVRLIHRFKTELAGYNLTLSAIELRTEPEGYRVGMLLAGGKGLADLSKVTMSLGGFHPAVPHRPRANWIASVMGVDIVTAPYEERR